VARLVVGVAAVPAHAASETANTAPSATDAILVRTVGMCIVVLLAAAVAAGLGDRFTSTD
jgi:hypothetical protein